jgi:hypothetical protein
LHANVLLKQVASSAITEWPKTDEWCDERAIAQKDMAEPSGTIRMRPLADGLLPRTTEPRII